MELETRPKGGVFFRFWRTKMLIFISCKSHIPNQVTKIFERKNGMVSYLSHMAQNIAKVCVFLLIPPCNKKILLQVDCLYSNNSGRIVLITISLNGPKVTLCIIYAANDHANQLQFLQELTNCITDKTGLTSLILGDWNCKLTKKIKWEVRLGNPLSIAIFGFIDIQRVRNPKLRKFTRVKIFTLKIQNRLFPNS